MTENKTRHNVPLEVVEILSHAREHTRLWNSLLKNSDLENDPWQSLPITNRQQVSTLFHDTVTEKRLEDVEAVRLHFRNWPGTPLFRKYQIFTSAGRDGLLTTFIYDSDTWNEYVRSSIERLAYTGLDVRLPFKIAFVGTDDPAHTQTRLAKEFQKLPRYSVAIFGLQQGLRQCVEGIQEFAPGVLYGFSSAVGLLAEEQVNGNLCILPHTILTGTDTLTEANRAFLKEAWGMKPFDCYGSTEGGLIGIECTAHEGLHLNERGVWLEIEDGQTLITNLTNKAQPIIRYLVPDKIELVEAPCRCGRKSPRLIPTEGRYNHILRLPGQNDGLAKVHPIAIRSALDTLPKLMASEAKYEESRLKVTIWGEDGINMEDATSRLADALVRCEVDLDRITIEVAMELTPKSGGKR